VVNELKEENKNYKFNVIKLDLTSLASVRQFAKEVCEQESQIDILINNAGVMMCPKWKTEDGFEMQIGTNHLGIYLIIHIINQTFFYLRHFSVFPIIILISESTVYYKK